jgi:hypothetical protein
MPVSTPYFALAVLSGGGAFGASGNFCGSPAGEGSGMRTSSQVCVRVLPKWMASGETSCVRLALSIWPAMARWSSVSVLLVGAADDARAIHRDLEKHNGITLLFLREAKTPSDSHSLAGCAAGCACGCPVVAGDGATGGGIAGGGCSTFTASSNIGCVYCLAGIG